ncbi:MAG TPA: M15 family metallopeptidase [Salinimicrobium sp.]|nr:M15 family metallopeptidase [Salinimicrobium sp.]
MTKYLLCLLLIFPVDTILSQENTYPPDGFVYLSDFLPDAIYDIRYAGSNNFVGKPITGYENACAIISEPAATALKKVQEELKSHGYTLKIFDAYRPQRAVDHFIIWAKDPADTLTKAQFYPEQRKKDLFSLGYIASKSGHSRGSTVDLTIVDITSGKELDMGSTYDFFGDISHHNFTGITKEQKQNRLILKEVMMKHGFRPYPEEWWHYTLRNEPYPDKYFDFVVK